MCPEVPCPKTRDCPSILPPNLHVPQTAPRRHHELYALSTLWSPAVFNAIFHSLPSSCPLPRLPFRPPSPPHPLLPSPGCGTGERGGFPTVPDSERNWGGQDHPPPRHRIPPYFISGAAPGSNSALITPNFEQGFKISVAFHF